jgi:hypothetical protein
MGYVLIIVGIGCLLDAWLGSSAPPGGTTVSLQLLVDRIVAGISGIGFLISGTYYTCNDSTQKLIKNIAEESSDKKTAKNKTSEVETS